MRPWVLEVTGCMHDVLPHVVLEVLEFFEDLILIILELEVFI